MSNAKFVILVVFAVTASAILLLNLGFYLAGMSCKINAEGLGMNYKYHPLAGCLIETEEGVYTNIGIYRTFN